MALRIAFLTLAIAWKLLVASNAAAIRSIEAPGQIVYPMSVSADGSTVVGHLGATFQLGVRGLVRPFHWTQRTGVVTIAVSKLWFPRDDA
jgi:hypothetical protein